VGSHYFRLQVGLLLLYHKLEVFPLSAKLVARVTGDAGRTVDCMICFERNCGKCLFGIGGLLLFLPN